MVRAILYPRVSSLQQAKQGDSIDAQTERLKDFCIQNNYEIVDIYTDEGKSASISSDSLDIRVVNGKFIVGIDLSKRPAFKKLLDEAGNGKFDTIIFYSWDRFSRSNMFSTIAREYFKRKGIQLIPTNDSNDSLLSDIKGSLSEDEIRKMKSRVREVRLYRFEKGIMPGRSHFGYCPILKNKKVVGFKPDKVEADIVKEIFKLASEGVDYKEICKKFGILWGSYYNIIKNRVYCGYIQFEGREKKGVHEPLISEEVWKKVNS
jgi:site-specific DNA recombinase